jgi:hypothetical protein
VSEGAYAILLLFPAGIFLWQLVSGVRSGVTAAVAMPRTDIRRTDNPVLFWMASAFNMAGFVMLIVIAVREAS